MYFILQVSATATLCIDGAQLREMIFPPIGRPGTARDDRRVGQLELDVLDEVAQGSPKQTLHVFNNHCSGLNLSYGPEYLWEEVPIVPVGFVFSTDRERLTRRASRQKVHLANWTEVKVPNIALIQLTRPRTENGLVGAQRCARVSVVLHQHAVFESGCGDTQGQTTSPGE